MHSQRAAFDRLLLLVTEEYGREELGSAVSGDVRRFKRVQRLLAGERIDSSELDYSFDRHHLGVVAGSSEARLGIRRLAAAINARSLIVNAPGGEVWAWLGSEEPFDLAGIRSIATAACSSSAPIGLGEPARDSRGWRLTHEQARLAFALAQAGQKGVVHYADGPLVAAAAQNPVLLASLQELYLAPLNREGEKGKRLRKTLRAYSSADRNASSAAAAIGVTGQTVKNHLREVEDRLGQPLSVCADAVDVALRLEELGILEEEVDNL